MKAVRLSGRGRGNDAVLPSHVLASSTELTGILLYSVCARCFSVCSTYHVHALRPVLSIRLLHVCFRVLRVPISALDTPLNLPRK